uniref:Ig-like domain-containing protein n=1 Tax=Glossina brevipalpis TaxID=37001 RepID=A0A1A9WLB3_9MUSC
MVNYDDQDGFFVKSNLLKEPPILDSNVGKSDEGFIRAINKSISQSQSSRIPPPTGFLLPTSISTLIIQKVHFHHAGNYTCAPSNARSASISVHVLQDEKPAAMQHSNRTIMENDSGINSFNASGINTTSNSSFLSIENCYYQIILLYVFRVYVKSIRKSLYYIQTHFKVLNINR